MTQGAGYYAILRRGDDEIELGPDEIEAPSLPDEHSVINEWQFETPSNEKLENYRHGELLLFFENEIGDRELDIRGPVDAVKFNDSTGKTRMRGNDILQYLEQEGPENGRVEADGIAWEEIKRVWGLIPGWTATVHEPEEELIAEERVVQDGDLRDIFGEEIDATDPVIVAENDVAVVQIGWTKEAEDAALAAGYDNATVVTDDDYTNGEAVDFNAGLNERFDLDFEIAYDAPPGDLRFAIRRDGRDGTESPGFEFYLDDEHFATIPEGGLLNQLGWFNESLGETVSAGTHTFSVRGTGNSGSGDFAFDHFAVYDNRFTDTDNEVHEPGGQLDAPQEYPDEIPIESDVVNVENAVTKAYLDVDCDTGAEQALAVRFHEDWLETGNTTSIEVDNPGDPTSSVQARVTLGHTGAVRDDQTPRTGWDPQSLTSWQLAVDETTLIVFEDQEFVGNWYQIMQEMHDQGGLIFRGIHNEDSLEAESFERGQLEDNVEWTRLDFESGYENMTDYANELTVVGGEDENGDRLVVTVDSEDEIERIGEVKPDYMISDRHVTESELLNVATVELFQRIGVDEEAGVLEIVPRRLKPGYAYYVDAFGGWSVLEKQTFQDGREPNCRAEFEEVVDISTAVAGLRRETRTGRR